MERFATGAFIAFITLLATIITIRAVDRTSNVSLDRTAIVLSTLFVPAHDETVALPEIDWPITRHNPDTYTITIAVHGRVYIEKCSPECFHALLPGTVTTVTFLQGAMTGLPYLTSVHCGNGS
jgi:hypothetical protein